MLKEVKNGCHFVGRLAYGKDIIEELKKIAIKKGIKAGWFQIIGALSYASVSEYDQKNQKYKKYQIFDRDLEILNLSGNISLLDDEVFIHAHLSASYEDKENKIIFVGGHLGESKIFAAECFITAFNDIKLIRSHDPKTNLNLWNKIL